MANTATQARHDPEVTAALIEWAEARRRGDADAEADAASRLRDHGIYVLIRLPGGAR